MRNQRLWKWGWLACLVPVFLAGCSDKFIVLHPKGPVGVEEKHLIILSTLLTAIVVTPVLIVLIYIVYRYRDTPGNRAPYRPDWGESKLLEVIWWGVPVIIIAIMAVYTGKSIFGLTNPPTTNKTPVTIQVTSLDWKWLFQYPDQNIATVNYVEIPAGKPIQFILTSDSPMNSFWVPQLGGQEYTMPGMAMRLWLQANKTGNYYGTGANFSGKGFAHMQFKVIAKTEADFKNWVDKVKRTAQPMDLKDYHRLRQQGLVGKQTYSSFPPTLYDKILKKNGGHYIDRAHEENRIGRQTKSGS